MERREVSILKRYYDNDQYNLAFDRWLNLMAELILKHGPAVLQELEKEKANRRRGVDYIVSFGDRKRENRSAENYCVIEYLEAA